MTAWTITSTWAPLDGDHLTPNVLTEKQPTWEAAKQVALQFACYRGLVRVEVTDPDGAVAATYDRSDNVFRRTAVGRAAEAAGIPTTRIEGARP